MLVLSRKPDEAITFPGLGITVSILRSSASVARIGIDAPASIRVLRKELIDGSEEETFDPASFEQAYVPASEDAHKVRNQLNTLNLGLRLYRHQSDAGQTDAADATFNRVLQQLSSLETQCSPGFSDEQPVDASLTLKRTLSVLLVEDDLDQREMLASLLSARGCEVFTAGDADEAMRFLEDNAQPDFVLLDMRMPTRDGASLVRQLRNSESLRQLRILATSGTSPADFGLGINTRGLDRWFPKPINTESLLDYMHTEAVELN